MVSNYNDLNPNSDRSKEQRSWNYTNDDRQYNEHNSNWDNIDEYGMDAGSQFEFADDLNGSNEFEDVETFNGNIEPNYYERDMYSDNTRPNKGKSPVINYTLNTQFEDAIQDPEALKIQKDLKMQTILEFSRFPTIDWMRDYIISFRSNVFRRRRRIERNKTILSRRGSNKDCMDTPLTMDLNDFDVTSPDKSNELLNKLPFSSLLSSPGFRKFKILLYNTIEGVHSWILIVMIAIILGFLSGYIDIVSAWMFSFKTGRCVEHWYLSRDICCVITEDPETCPEFKYWGTGFLILSPFINWGVYTITSTFLAFLAAFFVKFYAPLAAGSGNAEIKTILNGFNMQNFLGTPTMIIKAITLPLMVASGLAIGKEGPMIHVSACIASLVTKHSSRFTINESKKREFISAACAAGIAVAFAAPIGGVLFAFEELSTFFPRKTMLYSFFCALFATVTLQLIDPYRRKLVLYEVPNYRKWNFFEIIFLFILGIFNGIVGAIVIKVNQVLNITRKQSFIKNYPVSEVVIVAFITAVISYLNSFMRMDSSDLLGQLFQECSQTPDSFLCTSGIASGFLLFCSLSIALILRIFLTSISFGIKVPAGIFIPSMAWGALHGRLLGMFVEYYYRKHSDWPIFRNLCKEGATCVTPGMYAVIGAIGGLAGVTRLSLSLTVIAYELTGTLDYIIPCMITVLTARIIGDYFTKGGIAEFAILANKFPFLDNKDESLVFLTAKDIMTNKESSVVLWDVGMSISEIEIVLDKYIYSGFPIVKRNHLDTSSMPNIVNTENYDFVGYISRYNLHFLIDKLKLMSPDNLELDIGSDGNIFSEIIISFIPLSEIGANSSSNPKHLNGDVMMEFSSSNATVESSISSVPNLARSFSYSLDLSAENNENPIKANSNCDFNKGKHNDRIENYLGKPVVVNDILLLKRYNSFTKKEETLVDLYSYLDQMTIKVNPETDVEFIREIFQSIGSHHVIAEQYGYYEGLLTKKDLLYGLSYKKSRNDSDLKEGATNKTYDYTDDPLALRDFAFVGHMYLILAKVIFWICFSITSIWSTNQRLPEDLVDRSEYEDYIPKDFVKRIPKYIAAKFIELPYRIRTAFVYIKSLRMGKKPNFDSSEMNLRDDNNNTIDFDNSNIFNYEEEVELDDI